MQPSYFIEKRFPPEFRRDGSQLYHWYEIGCEGRISEDFPHHKIFRQVKAVCGFHDHRTLKQLQENCCPPEAEIEMLEVLGMDEDRRDSVEAATSLQKTGYLGRVF